MTCVKLLTKEELEEAKRDSTSGDSAQADWLETWADRFFGHIAALEREAAKVPEVVRVAETHGWNGVDNAKHLATFLDNELSALATLRAQAARGPELEEEVDNLKTAVAGADNLWEQQQSRAEQAESERDADRRESEGATRELEAIREALDDAGIPKATEEQCQGDRVDALAKRADELVKAVSEARAFVTSLHGAAGCNSMHSHLVPEVGCTRDNIIRLRNCAGTAESRVRELTAALESALVQWSGDRSLCTRCRTEQTQVLSPRVPHKHAKGCPLAVAPQDMQAQALDLREAATVLERVVKEVADAAELEAEAEEERSGDEESPVAARERGIVEGAREVLKRYRAALASHPSPGPGLLELVAPFVVVGRMLLRFQPPMSTRISGEVYRAEHAGEGVGVTALDFERLATYVDSTPQPPPTPPPGLLDAVVEKYAEEQTRLADEADAKSERDGDSHCMDACNREGRAAGAREVLPLLRAAFDTSLTATVQHRLLAAVGPFVAMAYLIGRVADLRRYDESHVLVTLCADDGRMAKVTIGDFRLLRDACAAARGESLAPPLYFVRRSVAALPHGSDRHALLATLDGLDAKSHGDAGKGATPALESGLAEERGDTLEVLADLLDCAMNRDALVAAATAAHEDAEAWRRMHRLLEDARAVEGVFWAALREADPTLDLDGKARMAVEEALAKAIRWAANIDGASDGEDPAADDDTAPSGPGGGERVNACGFAPKTAEDVAAFSELVQATARHIETHIAPTPTPEVSQRRSAEDVMWSIVAPHAQPTSPPLDLREAVGQLLAQRAKDDEWSTLNVSDAFRTCLTHLRAAYEATGGAAQTLDKAWVVEVLRKWLPTSHAVFDDLALATPSSGPGGGEGPSRDDVLNAFAVEADPAGALERYQREHPALAEELAALFREVLQPLVEQEGPLPDEDQALIHNAWKRHSAIKPKPTVDLWPTLTAFAAEMRRLLDKHRPRKGGREGWVRDMPAALLRRVREEAEEVELGLAARVPSEALLARCADVANMAMMVADAYGHQRARVTPTPEVPALQPATEPIDTGTAWEGDEVAFLGDGTPLLLDGGTWRPAVDFLRLDVQTLTNIGRALADALRTLDITGRATSQAVLHAARLGAEEMRGQVQELLRSLAGDENITATGKMWLVRAEVDVRALPLLGKAVRRG